MDIHNIGQTLILFILLILSAFFSTSETALMALSRIRVRHMVEENIKGADLINKYIAEPNKLLGTILVGNNIVNIGASALATAIAIDFYGDKGVLIATIAMTVLVLVFAEITPKSLAAQNAEKISLRIIKPIALVIVLLHPIVIVFTFITGRLMKILGANTNKVRPFITEDELRTVVNVSQEEGVLEVHEKEMIYNVFEFGDQQIRDVMVQRTDIIAIDIEDTYEEVIEIIKNEKFSRYPIYEEGIDNIVGIINVRDLLFVDNLQDNFNIKEYIRKPYYTFEYKKIADLFKEMKKNKVHIAIALDEYGGTAGIVTLEDLIEEIVGDIQDEYDEYEKEIEVIRQNEYRVKGNTKIELVNEMIGTAIESEDFDSIGGFIIGELGRFPKLGETINFNHIKLVVEDIEGNKIKKIRIFT
ncbi:putative Mg2+ and Co2+ transporter CorB [Clostridium aceticum]|uniref:Putative Mg2+ and Co2+ transporter CorB n=1 Tax=Clostridium aceticum TaxID=84022 RepID=A0A0D8IDU9_9CLOT|nr:hemolysin family protein [Clostridium aceticum]AKL94209.1 putative Mg2+ and Co2+ transporter CorB [Clostridium aceticum]KJF28453.1 hemolysin [Clostridium aceticum]